MERRAISPVTKVTSVISYFILIAGLLTAFGMVLSHTLGEQMSLPFNL